MGRVTELEIVLEPEPLGASVQVYVPAKVLATREMAMDSESAERSSAHSTMAEGELSSVDFDMDIYADLPAHLPPSSELNCLSALNHLTEHGGRAPVTGTPGFGSGLMVSVGITHRS